MDIPSLKTMIYYVLSGIGYSHTKWCVLAYLNALEQHLYYEMNRLTE